MRISPRAAAVAFLVLVASPALAAAQQPATPRLNSETFDSLRWRNIGPEGNRFSAVAGIPGNPQVYYAGAASGGVYKTTDDGITWAQKSVDPTGFLKNSTVLSLYHGGGFLLAGTGFHGLFRSTDGGENWAPESDGFQDADVQVLDVAPTATNLIAGTSEGIYYSSDQGDHWLLTNVPSGTITAVAAAGSFGYANVVTGFFQSDGIYRSTNNGQIWNVVFQGLDASYIATMAAEGSLVYAGMFTGGLIRSTNNGTTWADHSPAAGIGIFAIFPLGNDIYAGSDADGAGVYHSSDHGVIWSPFGDGLPADAPVNALAASTSYLFAGTEEDGVWRIVRTGNAGAGDLAGGPLSLRLAGAIPNPIRDRGVVDFALPAAGVARIRLLDVMGRGRGVLLDSTLPAGPHRIGWNAAGLGTGVYFLRLDAGGGSRSAKVIVAR